MKKIWIIIGSVILLILILGGAWWYLLMNGRPESLSGIPNPFGSFGGSNEFVPVDVTEDTQEERQTSTALKKISTTPVAGSIIFEQDGTTKVRYVERGTGHIYEVDTDTQTGVRLVNITIPRTTEAFWSPQGNRVVITAEESPVTQRVFVNTLEKNDAGETVVTSTELPGASRSIAFGSNGDVLYYLMPTSAGSTGYRYDLKTNTRIELFNSVLRDITVSWEPEILAYTTPSARVPGYAYRGSEFERIAGGVTSLMLTPTKSSFVTTFLTSEGSLVSYGAATSSTPLTVSVFPEKCAADREREHILWCGASVVPINGEYPDAWYQGVASLDDMVWEIDAYTGSAALISIPSEDVGEIIDILDMHVNNSSSMLIFTNKRDGLLWLQELPQNIVPDTATEDTEQTEGEE
ncbi:MAG: hypothetical protein KBD21_05390 [Candidatus Pacebacteria bacterium]|nr:hypothetical protein [Candidatus Paceibacterota bacterium]